MMKISATTSEIIAMLLPRDGRWPERPDESPTPAPVINSAA